MNHIGYILPIIAAVILAAVDACRIANNMGRGNIDKDETLLFAGIGFVVCSIGLSFEKLPVYFVYYTAVRGVVYAPVLNLLRGLPFDYFSDSTNSKIDKLFGSFWLLFAVSAIVAILSSLAL